MPLHPYENGMGQCLSFPKLMTYKAMFEKSENVVIRICSVVAIRISQITNQF